MADHPAGTVLWKLILETEISTTKCQNVFHFTNLITMTDQQLPGFTQRTIDDFIFFHFADITAVQSFGLVWIRITSTAIIPHFGPVAAVDVSPGSNGGVQSEPLATFNAMVISKQTGLSGRQNRGRLYIPGVAVTDVILNDLEENAFSRLRNIATRFKNVFGPNGQSGTFQMIHYSHKVGDDANGRPTIAGIIPIIQWNARQQIFTQRHRLKGIGI